MIAVGLNQKFTQLVAGQKKECLMVGTKIASHHRVYRGCMKKYKRLTLIFYPKAIAVMIDQLSRDVDSLSCDVRLLVRSILQSECDNVLLTGLQKIVDSYALYRREIDKLMDLIFSKKELSRGCNILIALYELLMLLLIFIATEATVRYVNTRVGYMFRYHLPCEYEVNLNTHSSNALSDVNYTATHVYANCESCDLYYDNVVKWIKALFSFVVMSVLFCLSLIFVRSHVAPARKSLLKKLEHTKKNLNEISSHIELLKYIHLNLQNRQNLLNKRAFMEDMLYKFIVKNIEVREKMLR